MRIGGGAVGKVCTLEVGDLPSCAPVGKQSLPAKDNSTSQDARRHSPSEYKKGTRRVHPPAFPRNHARGQRSGPVTAIPESLGDRPYCKSPLRSPARRRL